MPSLGVDRAATIQGYVRTNYLERIDWMSRKPELLLATVGRLWGADGTLPLTASEIIARGPAFRFSDRSEAMRLSVVAVRDILSATNGTVLFLQMPLFQELEGQGDGLWRGLVKTLAGAVPQAKFVSMHARMAALLEGKRLQDHPHLARKTTHQITALPDNQKPEIYRWFFLPDDTHYTDHGTTLYAEQVAAHLVGTVRAAN
jgi:hypothetical protein